MQRTFLVGNQWNLHTVENRVLKYYFLLSLYWNITRLTVMIVDFGCYKICFSGASRQTFWTKQFNGGIWLCSINCGLPSYKTIKKNFVLCMNSELWTSATIQRLQSSNQRISTDLWGQWNFQEFHAVLLHCKSAFY